MTMPRSYLFIPWMVMMVIKQQVFSQTLSFQSYTSAQGLSQNSGYCITQDNYGFIWMGTQDGLNKFNGHTINTYYKETCDRGQLTDNYIKTIFFDSASRWLWVGTAGGLCIYNCTADSFYKASVYFPRGKILDSIMIRKILPGRNDKEIIAVTFSEGLFICNTDSKAVYHCLQKEETKNSTGTAVAWNGNIYAASNKKLYRLFPAEEVVLQSPLLDDIRSLLVWQQKLWAASPKTGMAVITNDLIFEAKPFATSSTDIGVLATDKYNNLWIGTRDKGIIILDPKNLAALYSFSDAPNQAVWPPKFTLSLFKDRQNNMWAGSSGGGFSILMDKKKEFGLIQKTEQQYGKMAHNMILSVYKPPSPDIYIGTQLEGLRLYNTASGATQSLPTAAAKSIYAIAADKNQTLWLATTMGLHSYNTQTKQSTRFVDSNYKASFGGQHVYKYKKYDSLIYSGNNGTVLFDIKNRQFSPFVKKYNNIPPFNLVIYKVTEDRQGTTWLATLGNCLCKYDITNGQLTAIKKTATISKIANCIYNNADTLWVGTNNGLFTYSITEDSILKTLSTANGLPGNVIYSIEKDTAGDFWCGSNVGLIKINGQSLTVTQIKASAGLQGDEFNTACSVSDRDGRLYFGGINGITWFNPLDFTINNFSPAPLIESIKIFNKPFLPEKNTAVTDAIILSHEQNFITIEYCVTNFINHDECLYKYKLLNVDADWVMAGSRTYVNYPNLMPGNYTFLLQSSNSSGVWSPVTKLDIRIMPAWWQTWYAKAFVILLFTGSVAAMTMRRIHNIKRSARLKQKIAETEMAALKAQMNPHFMFNCINSIDAFIQSNDKYNATLYLNKFARLIRNVLDNSKENLVLFSKDIETLKLYTELEQLRSDHSFHVAYYIDDVLMKGDYKVPPLIVQPFIENAIIHGLRNKETKDGLLEITISLAENQIKYLVKDNGIGRQAAARINSGKEKSYGMQMSHDRVMLFNKEKEPSVTVVDLVENGQPAGTEVSVHLNII